MFGPSRRVARRTARRTSRRQMAMQGGYDEPEYAEPAPAPMQAAPAQPSYTQELEQLAQLKAQGIISDEDYEAKKKQILGI